MESQEILRMLNYWDMQVNWAEKALDYANSQRLYLLGKLAVATPEVPQLMLVEGGLDAT